MSAGAPHLPTPVPAAPAPVPAGSGRRAWAVFTGRTEIAWLRVLRPGFRHCFLVLADGPHWVTMDPLAAFTEIAVQPVGAAFDLPGHLAARGLTVVPAPLDHVPRRPAPWGPFTCVEAVKRAIGLADPRIVTPYQLYRRLAAAAERGSLRPWEA
ncbi:MAG: hypothetical protein RID91_20510 [Azospirillaceae bacterium]